MFLCFGCERMGPFGDARVITASPTACRMSLSNFAGRFYGMIVNHGFLVEQVGSSKKMTLWYLLSCMVTSKSP